MRSSTIGSLIGVLLVASFAYSQETTAAKEKENCPFVAVGGTLGGQKMDLPKQEYPVVEPKFRADGFVVVVVEIDEKGGVTSARAVHGPEFLRSPAETAALGSKFKPAMLSGTPVKARGRVVYYVVCPKYGAARREKVKYLRLGFRVNFPVVIFGLTDSSSWIDPLKEIYPAIDEEFKAVAQYAKMSGQKDAPDLFEQINKRIEAKLPARDVWQYVLGKKLAQLIYETAAISGDKSKWGKSTDAYLKVKLMDIGEQLKAAPADFPAEVLQNFRNLADLAGKESLSSDEGMKLIESRVSEIIETSML